MQNQTKHNGTSAIASVRIVSLTTTARYRNLPSRFTALNAITPCLKSLLLGIGLLASLTAMISPAQAAVATRTSTFDYNITTGLLIKEVIEPGDSNLCLVTQYDYDNFGNKTSVTTRNCNGTAANATTGSPAEAAAPTGNAVIVARTATTSYTALTANDITGRFPYTATNALGHTETRVFDSRFGNLAQVTGPNGLISKVTTDTFGRAATEISPEGNVAGAIVANFTTTTTRDLCLPTNTDCPPNSSYWINVAKPGTPSATAYFDKFNRQLRSKTIGLDGITAIFKDTQYDAKGRVLKTSRPYFKGASVASIAWTSYIYDDLNRVKTETAPLPVSVTDNFAVFTTYNYAGLTTTITTPSLVGDQVTTRVKNSQGQLASVTDANNKTINYTYDPFGNLTTTTDPLNNVSILAYDPRGRKTGMNDPDMGVWTYAYNALGELIKQTDAKGQITTNTYDKLGRMTYRVEPDLSTEWVYDNAVTGYGKGKIAYITTDNGLRDTYSYDDKGRAQSNSRGFGTVNKATSPWTFTPAATPLPTSFGTNYDVYGRVDSKVTNLAGEEISIFSQQNLYQNGYLYQVRNALTSQVYWTMNSLTADGQIATATYGNGVAEVRSFDNLGRTLSTTDTISTTIVTGMNYQYDRLGNLVQRTDVPNGGLIENYTYDILNRLKSATITNPAQVASVQVAKSFLYDDLGNLTSKSDTGIYTYAAYRFNGTNRPHAVSNIAGSLNASYTYDANGNVLSDGVRNYVYTSFNLPATITKGATTTTLLYGPSHERAKETEANGTVSYNFNPRLDSGLHADYRVKANGDKAYVNYLYAGNRPVGTYTINWAAASNTTSYDLKYFHLDGQGSIIAITNSVGAVVERLSYDAWGKRRNADGTDDTANTLNTTHSTDHGYTGHEHLDDMGLIHMNGRVYDPRTGRFLQADPIIQSPGNLQNFNRYSYVLNNPFLYTDPSGFSFWTKLRGVAKIIVGTVLTVASTSGCTACGYAAIPFFQSGVNDLNGDPSTKDLSIPPINIVNIPIDGPGGNSVGNIGGNSGSNNDGNSNDVNRSGYSREDMSRYSRELSQKISGTLLISGDADIPEFYNEGCNCTRYPIDDMGPPLEKVYLLESVVAPVRGVSATLSVVGRSENMLIQTTAHGSERIAGIAATRGGVLSESGVNIVRQSGQVMTQADGATVRILKSESGRFSVVVEGDRGVITTFDNISQKSLTRLGKNYGWK